MSIAPSSKMDTLVHIDLSYYGTLSEEVSLYILPSKSHSLIYFKHQSRLHIIDTENLFEMFSEDYDNYEDEDEYFKKSIYLSVDNADTPYEALVLGDLQKIVNKTRIVEIDDSRIKSFDDFIRTNEDNKIHRSINELLHRIPMLDESKIVTLLINMGYKYYTDINEEIRNSDNGIIYLKDDKIYMISDDPDESSYMWTQVGEHLYCLAPLMDYIVVGDLEDSNVTILSR